MLDTVLALVSSGVKVLGGALVAWGGVQLGLAIKDPDRGGQELASAFGFIIGGAVIIAAAVFFSTSQIGTIG